MNYFQDSFNVGAGATLGSMATMNLINMGEGIVNYAQKNAYIKYRSQYFDPIVRADICDVAVRGNLLQKNYPFPSKKKNNFFKRHKIFTGLLILYILGYIAMLMFEWTDLYIAANILLIFTCFGIIFKKIGKLGAKAVTGTYKTQLENDGQQYWYIREYIRQALERHELTEKEAILKMCNTRLAQQLPDTVEEIDAHLFYYRQKLGMN